LPGLTRQSIRLRKTFLQKKMDARVKPAHDWLELLKLSRFRGDERMVGLRTNEREESVARPGPYPCGLKLTAVRVTRRSRIITTPMITMTRPALSAPRSCDQSSTLASSSNAEKLGGVSDGDGLGVAAERA
jgi:hypothetical protein